MICNFLQEDTLQNGLSEYLYTYKYRTAETKDLWHTFSKNSNQTVDLKVSIAINLRGIFYQEGNNLDYNGNVDASSWIPINNIDKGRK